MNRLSRDSAGRGRIHPETNADRARNVDHKQRVHQQDSVGLTPSPTGLTLRPWRLEWLVRNRREACRSLGIDRPWGQERVRGLHALVREPIRRVEVRVDVILGVLVPRVDLPDPHRREVDGHMIAAVRKGLIMKVRGQAYPGYACGSSGFSTP